MDEQNRIGIEVNDVGCEFVSVVQLDLVNAKVLYSNFPLEKCCNSRWFLAQQVIF